MTIDPKVAAQILGIILKCLHAAANELIASKLPDSEAGKKVTKEEVLHIVEAALDAAIWPITRAILHQHGHDVNSTPRSEVQD